MIRELCLVTKIYPTSPATVKRDIALLKKEGKFIITRGAKLDMGPGISHKSAIIELYFKGYSFSEVEQKTNHSEMSVKRYLADFVQIASLLKQKFSHNQIRLIAQKSDRIIREYSQIYDYYNKLDNKRLQELISPKNQKVSAKKKSSLSSGRGGKTYE